VLLLTLRGVPFLYYGEELGLEDAVVPADRVVDPGGRDGCRAPMPWDATSGHGWPGAEPWLPWPPEPEIRNVAGLRADGSSILNLYRRLTAARRASAALRTGSVTLLASPEGVLAYQRRHGGDVRTVLVNVAGQPADVVLDGRWLVEVAADGAGEGAPFAGPLEGDGAVVLRPA
jgi:alpha-glucosidase